MTSKTELTRRNFAQGALLVGGCLVIAAACGARNASADEASPSGSLNDVQYGFLVRLDRCSGCENCVAACRTGNQLSPDTPDRRVVTSYLDEFQKTVYASTACNHCADPNCLRVCPAGAISKGAAGIVSVDKDRCIGCKYCFQACPYGVPHYNSTAMDKCDCCLDAGIAPGDTPFCVQACKFGALEYGPLNELRAEAEGRSVSVVPVGEECTPSCLLVTERG